MTSDRSDETVNWTTPNVLTVFISYSRKDIEFAEQLVRRLRHRGFDVSIDREDISAGEDWRRRLKNLIKRSPVFVRVLSPDALASPVCEWEYKCARSLKRRIVPVLYRPLGEGPAARKLMRTHLVNMSGPDGLDSGGEELCRECLEGGPSQRWWEDRRSELLEREQSVELLEMKTQSDSRAMFYQAMLVAFLIALAFVIFKAV